MPLLTIRSTPGTFEADGRARFVQAITQAAWRAESIPDDPLARMRAVVLWSDIAAGDVYWGGECAQDLVRSVFADYHVGDGVLDPVRRQEFAAAFHAAAVEASPADDERHTATSVVFVDVPEGRWGRDGAIHRLPAMAAAAGFEHLAAVAAP